MPPAVRGRRVPIALTTDPRRRITGALFGGAALGTTGSIAATTIGSIAAVELAGSESVAGFPGAAATLGTALGATLLTSGFLAGRRRGLLVGYGVGAFGAVAAIGAVIARSVIVVVLAFGLVGISNAANQIARFANADMYPGGRKAAALGLIVWAGTVGSVAGPTLLAPAGTFAQGLGWPASTGGLLVAGLTLGTAFVLHALALRPDPSSLVVDDSPTAVASASLGAAFALPPVRMATAALVGCQVVMILVMTATPVHLMHAGADLSGVGLVMSAHTLGMFAFSPLTGRLSDRAGNVPVILTGLAVTAVAALLASFTASGVAAPGAALFLLGIGWNLSFVAGSALLAASAPAGVRVRLQGRVDTVTWSASAVASLASGLLLAETGYRALALIGLGLLLFPAALVVRNRRTVLTAA